MRNTIQPEPNDRNCDLCAGTDFQLIGQRDRHGAPLATSLCLTCGLVAHADIPDESELELFYSHRYRSDYKGESTPSNRRVMRAWKNGCRILAQLSPFLKPHDTILEVGAGVGCTVKAFQQSGFRAEGIEPHLGFQRFARRQLRAAVRLANLAELCESAPSKPWHAILLVHVIEHLRSPRQALTTLHRLLSNDGLLYVECPNLAAPFASRNRLFHFAHIHNFTPATLTTLAEQCGFEVVDQFDSETSTNLQVLLRKTNTIPELALPSDAARRTLTNAFRYSNWQYHCRPSYWMKRSQQLVQYANEFIYSKAFVKQLVPSLPHTTPASRPAFAAVQTGSHSEALVALQTKS